VIELLRPYIQSLVDPVRESISRAVTSAVELLVAGLLGLVCLGFLVAALEIWLSERYGPLAATLILAGAFFVLALIVMVIRLASDASARTKAEKAAKERA
jgi:predicted acyltransferase